MKTCPTCEGPLTAAFNQHVDFPVENISEGMVAIEEHNGDCYDSELIHIACSKCDKYWYSIADFLEDAKEREKA